MSTFTIARLTFHEAARRKILLAALVLGLVFLTVFGMGFNYIYEEFQRDVGSSNLLVRSEIFNFLMMAGLYVVNFLTIIMTVLTSVDTLSGEISSGTIQTLITKPMPRWQIVVGKWLGFMLMMALYVLLMGGGVTALVYWIADYQAENVFWGLGLIWLNGLLMLSISLMGGTVFSTLANGVLVFGLFGVSFVGGWVEHIGSFLSNQAAVNVGIVSSLLMPSEALWRRAAYEMRSPLVSALGFSPFTSSTSIPSPAMVWYAVVYALGMLGLAIWFFKRRDL